MNILNAHATACTKDCMCMFALACVSPKSTIFSLAVLSADRVEQMTKTYNDMEVVTQLLAEVGVLSLATFNFSVRSSVLLADYLCSCWTAGQRLGAGGSNRSVASAEEPPAAGTQRGLRGAASTGPGPGSFSMLVILWCMIVLQFGCISIRCIRLSSVYN